MKKFLIFLIIFLVSILYVPRGTLALTSEHYSQWFYTSQTMTNVENNIDKINSIKEFIVLNGFKNINITSGNYVLMFKPSTLSNNDIYVYLLTPESWELYNYYRNSSLGQYELRYGFVRAIYNYNNGVVSLSPNDRPQTGNNYVKIGYTTCNPTSEDCFGDRVDDYYFDTSYLDSSFNISFKNSTLTSITQIPYKIDDVIYSPPTNVPLKKMLDSFGGITPVGVCQNPITRVGELKRVKSFQVSINGISNALKEEMSGNLSFTYNGERLKNDDITMKVTARTRNFIRYDDMVVGDYDLQCSQTQNKCDIFYSYKYEDDIDAPLELIFSLDFGAEWAGDISITNCEYSGVFENYSYKYENVDDFNAGIENYLNNSSIGGVDDFLLDFFGSDNFSDKHGISSIIQTPITFLEGLNSKTCAPIQINIPFINKNAEINCMSEIYTSKFNGIYSLIVLAVNSVLCYNLALSVVGYIKQAKNPDDDRIEVLDL